MIVQLTRFGTEVGSAETIARARAEFAERRSILIREFFAPSLLERLVPMVDQAPFRIRVHDRVDPPPVDLGMKDDAVEGRFLFLANDPRLFAVIREITRCDPIRFYQGVVYRMIPGQGHFDSWHDDLDGNRMVALSVNLGAQRYEGGVLRVRHRETQEVYSAVHNTGFGDAILFALAPELEHCLTQVTGEAPKTALAGWFQRGPAYVQNIRTQGRVQACR